jgi:large subunit ribosomal protein L15
LPLARRLPKRGFNNKRFATIYIPVNLDSLNQFEDGVRVDEAELRKVGLVNGRGNGVKILARGKLEKKLTVCAASFSTSARAAIVEKGGTCEDATKGSAVSKGSAASSGK